MSTIFKFFNLDVGRYKTGITNDRKAIRLQLVMLELKENIKSVPTEIICSRTLEKER